jgi:hypothetical protein
MTADYIERGGRIYYPAGHLMPPEDFEAAAARAADSQATPGLRRNAWLRRRHAAVVRGLVARGIAVLAEVPPVHTDGRLLAGWHRVYVAEGLDRSEYRQLTQRAVGHLATIAGEEGNGSADMPAVLRAIDQALMSGEFPAAGQIAFDPGSDSL